jgi:hypothetical protein
MREMKYGKDRKREVLDTGYCLGFLYYIMNLGTYPTAYIKIPKDHKYYEKDYGEIDLDVNGGVTYSEEGLNISDNQRIEGWFIGWDYAHYGDYIGFELIVPERYRTGEKKWTTKEIYEEVRQACYQLNELKGEQS